MSLAVLWGSGGLAGPARARASGAADGVCAHETGVWADLAEPPPPEAAPAASKSDEAFLEKDGLEFSSSWEEVPIDDLNGLFVKVGFPERDTAKWERGLANTHSLIFCRAARKSRWAKEGQLVGFARATSDGVFNATIWDVAVLPAWQGCGIGRAMMERLTAALVEEGIANVNLFAEPAVESMYGKMGWSASPGGVRGMAYDKSKAHNIKLMER